MKKGSESSVQKVLEEITFTLNEIKQEKLKNLEKTKLTPQQEKILEEIEKELDICTTKLGLLLHPKEL